MIKPSPTLSHNDRLLRPLDLLIIQDSKGRSDFIIREFIKAGFKVKSQCVNTASKLIKALQAKEWDIIISNQNLNAFTSLQALSLTQKIRKDAPFIIISHSQSEEMAVIALKAGAHDFISKSRLARLVPAVERELTEAQGRRIRKNLEKQLQQSQKMEAIGKLTGGIAHDFNNILSVIQAFTDCMLTDLQDKSRKQNLKNDIGEIREAAARGATLTRQLLAFSRRQILQPVMMDLNASVMNMKEMLQRLLGENIRLVTRLDSHLWPIKADPGQIEQVILNLSVNARDAMPRGGRLILSTENVNWDPSQSKESYPDLSKGEYALFTVKDGGVGIPAEDLPHIFDPFFTTKEKGKGTGLGLSTVFGIVKQSGGAIFVQSQPGQGTTFQIFLHRTNLSPAPKVKPVVHAPSLDPSKTILLVEDETKLRSILKRYLESKAYTVLSASNGLHALDIAKNFKGHIHLMITDIVMPIMDGLALAKKMKSLRPHTSILYMSGYSNHALFKSEAFKAHDNFLMKPFNMNVLDEKVHQIFSSSASSVKSNPNADSFVPSA